MADAVTQMQIGALQAQIDKLELRASMNRKVPRCHRKLTAAKRREVILFAAIQVLAAGEFTIAKVASACRVRTSPATILHHFGSREKLIEACQDATQDRSKAA